MDSPEWVILVILLLALFWYLSMRARELAVSLARTACTQMGAELLDDTVALSSLGWRRNGEGRLVLRRVYTFDFSPQRLSRRQGTLILLGEQQESLLLSPEDGRQKIHLIATGKGRDGP